MSQNTLLNKIFPLSVGQAAMLIRRKLALTQVEIAAKSGINQARYCRFETGSGGLDPDELGRVCRAMGIDVWELFWVVAVTNRMTETKS